MKRNARFIIIIIIIMIVAIIIESSLPRKFNWNPTFSKHDKEPFGCFVFDDIMSTSLEKGYEVTNKSLYLLLNEDNTEPKSIVSISDDLKFSGNDINTLLKIVEEGNKVMLISSYIDLNLTRKLGIEHNSSPFFNLNNLRDYVIKNPDKRNKLILIDEKFDKKYYEFYPQFCYESFTIKSEEKNNKSMVLDEDGNIFIETSEQPDDINKTISSTDKYKINVIASNSENKPVALEFSYGKGKLYLVANSLIFTNYGMLDKDNAGYIFSIFSYIDDFPVLRTEAYNKNSTEHGSPLRYFLSQKSLRWALYIAIIVILLFMIFTAKRKQRVIPVVKSPENKTVEFVELIGTLYFQRKNYKDLLHKKYIYFVEQLKRNTYIDIEGEDLTIELCRRLSDKTGVEAEKLYHLILELKYTINDNGTVNETQMKNLINRINEILNKIR